MTDSSPISQATLDALWDFTDPAASAERFRVAAAAATDDAAGRAELATQRARALGLLGRFDEAESVLDDIVESSAASTELVLARVALERGRLRVAAGRPQEGVPFFTLAARHAAADGSRFLALDALHMLALTDVEHEEEWAADGLAMLHTVTDARTRRWGVALHNNLGWLLHDTGRSEEALAQFEQALETADTCGTHDQRFRCRWTVARCLRTLGRTDEARAVQEQLAAERPEDEFVRAELAALMVSDSRDPTQPAGPPPPQ